MKNNLALGMVLILVFQIISFLPVQYGIELSEDNNAVSFTSTISQNSFYVGQSEIALVDSSHIVIWENDNLTLINLRNNSVIDSASCDRAMTFYGTTEFDNPFSINKTRELITCENTVLEWDATGFSHRYNGTFFMGADPVYNTTISTSTGAGCSNNEYVLTIYISRNNTSVTQNNHCVRTTGNGGPWDIILSDEGKHYTLGVMGAAWPSNEYVCLTSSMQCVIQQSNGGNYHRVPDIVNAGMSMQIVGSGSGASAQTTFRITNPYSTVAFSGYNIGDTGVQAAALNPSCNMAVVNNDIYLNGTIINSGVTGITSIDCLDHDNYSYVQFGVLKSVWQDGDQDGVNDLEDQFNSDSTQWSDLDGDGYGDNPIGTTPDSCPNVIGNSTIDEFGCKDRDGDGYSDTGDAFPNNGLSWSDSDDDGYPDQGTTNDVDDCPTTPGESMRNGTLGCPDTDFDGWADSEDAYHNESSQWSDQDGDGYGDELNGFQGDACPSVIGNSTEDRFGCTDSDGDGWSDDGDDLPQEPTQWKDRDGDGYGENPQGVNLDSFPADGTQWNDTDGDGHGDNLYGAGGDWFPNDATRWQDSDRDGVADEDDAFPNEVTQWNDTDGDGYGDEETGDRGDAFPNDSTRWQDSDRDGIADEDDAFPNEVTQWNDTDGDGYGDEKTGNRGDAFPNDVNEWADSDMDGLGNNADAFPFDPTQTEDRDDDGMGDNPMGIGADKFPDDATQWGDIDGDGYGDNPLGNNPDVFITDATQWSDADGDGYGDNPTGRLYDQFPQNPTQWVDDDGDGLGDNLNGTDADPYLNDFDNDGYNDSIDPLPKLSSPGDLDADGCLDEDDAFPSNSQECLDNDGDGEGDNADVDDDNDGWADTDEIRLGTDQFNSAEEPVESFEIVIPGTSVGLGAWDLIGMFGGIPLFVWIGFGFVTRNTRCAKYEVMLREANTRDELESVAYKWEYSLMLRMLGPHQGIRLERLRAELDDVFESQNQKLSSIDNHEFDQTKMVVEEMNDTEKQVPELVTQGDYPSIEDTAQKTDENGYEWFTAQDGTNFYRTIASQADWTRLEN
jgi:hypothetical protein